jgi:uncharacterized protein YukE
MPTPPRWQSSTPATTQCSTPLEQSFTGQAPKTHDRSIQRFGLLVRDLDDALRASGKALNEVKDERSEADYNETVLPSSDEARDALQAAVDFLDVRGARYGFRPIAPSPLGD